VRKGGYHREVTVWVLKTVPERATRAHLNGARFGTPSGANEETKAIQRGTMADVSTAYASLELSCVKSKVLRGTAGSNHLDAPSPYFQTGFGGSR